MSYLSKPIPRYASKYHPATLFLSPRYEATSLTNFQFYPNLNPRFGSHVCPGPGGLFAPSCPLGGGAPPPPNLMPISGFHVAGTTGGLCLARWGMGAGICAFSSLLEVFWARGGGCECEGELYVRGIGGLASCCCRRAREDRGGRERSLVGSQLSYSESLWTKGKTYDSILIASSLLSYTKAFTPSLKLPTIFAKSL